MTDITMDKVGTICYKRWVITHRALNRYIERFGGDVGDLIFKLEESFLPMNKGKNIDKRKNKILRKFEKEGGYILTDGDTLFLIKQHDAKHFVITCMK